MKKVLMSVLAFGAIVSNVNAGCAQASVGAACSNVDITRLYVTTGGTYVGTSADETTVGAGCTTIGNVYFLLQKTHANYQTMHSTLLAAQLSGKKAYVRLMPDTAHGDRCKVVYMMISD